MSASGEGMYPSMTVSTPNLTPGQYPTPYSEVNAALAEVLAGAQTALGDQFAGMYLYGSLATGDFDPKSSDIDALVVTDGELSDKRFAALAAMHARFAAGSSPWATEIEVSYLPRDTLCRYDPTDTLHPRIDRGSGLLRVQPHDVDWVIQRSILRERGVRLAGPALDTLIDPVHPDAMRRATVELMREWWAPMRHDPERLRRRGYQAYAVLTMCRALYTLQYGAVASKPVAARWAQRTLDARWSALIARALAWRKEYQVVLGDDLSETQALIQYTLDRCDRTALPLERSGFH